VVITSNRPWGLTDVLEGVWRAARPERHAAGRHPEHGTAGLEPEVTVEDVPQLVFAQVRAQRWALLWGRSRVPEP
jgi:hypothetical protein